MTWRQKILKLAYPVLNALTTSLGKNNKTLQSNTMASTPFYNLKVTLNNGKEFDFSQLKDKKVLIVNTASDCGFTNQYEGLQALYEKYKEHLQIIGFPSNDFGEQEKGTDDDIEQFCKINYGVTFPLTQKTTVIKKEGQHQVYNWLTDENKNGWNYVVPSWNFCKFLIDEEGNLTHFFEAAVEPMSKEITNAINAPLSIQP